MSGIDTLYYYNVSVNKFQFIYIIFVSIKLILIAYLHWIMFLRNVEAATHTTLVSN